MKKLIKEYRVSDKPAKDVHALLLGRNKFVPIDARISVYCRSSTRGWHKGGGRKHWLAEFHRLAKSGVWRSVPHATTRTYSIDAVAMGFCEDAIEAEIDQIIEVVTEDLLNEGWEAAPHGDTIEDGDPFPGVDFILYDTDPDGRESVVDALTIGRSDYWNTAAENIETSKGLAFSPARLEVSGSDAEPGTTGFHGAKVIYGDRVIMDRAGSPHPLKVPVAWQMECPCGLSIPEMRIDALRTIFNQLADNDPPVKKISIDALLRVLKSAPNMGTGSTSQEQE